MTAVGKITWTKPTTDVPYPTFGVLPVAPAKAHKLHLDGLHTQVEPWKVTLDGMIHSYRIGILSQPDAKPELTVGVEGSPTADWGSSPALEYHPSVVKLLKLGSEVELQMKHISGDVFRAKALKVTEAGDRYKGSVEHVVTTAGSFKPSQGGESDARTAFTALATAYSGTPYVTFELIWHNGNWKQAVKSDVLHQGIELVLPAGYKSKVVGYDPNHFSAPSDFCHALPQQGVRLSKFLIWHEDDGEPDDSVAPQMRYFTIENSMGNINKLAWDNPFCASYLTQGLPVRFDPLRAQSVGEKHRQDFSARQRFDEFAQPAYGLLENCEFYAEGTSYGGAGSSLHVERFGDAGLAIHGQTDVLQQLQQLTLNRMPIWLMDEDGEHINADDYAPGDRLAWRLFLTPLGRGTNFGRPYPNNVWYGGKETFGYDKADFSDFDLAEQQGITCPYLEDVYNYGPYDRQHFKRALRATLPLAFVCGDRVARFVLQQHAHVARAEFWEGEGQGGVDTTYDNRVGWMFNTVMKDPQGGMPGGREDAWAMECVHNCLVLKRGPYANRFKRWISSYATILRNGQMPLETSDGNLMIDRGVIQSTRSGKELDQWGHQFYIAQGYQDGMLAWAAHGIASMYGAPNLTTAFGQLMAHKELFGTPPAYKIAVEHIGTGLICSSKAIQQGFPFPKTDDVQGDWVPSVGCCALTAVWANESFRKLTLDYVAKCLGMTSTEELATYVPPNANMERQAACLRPMAEWLQQNALLSE